MGVVGRETRDIPPNSSPQEFLQLILKLIIQTDFLVASGSVDYFGDGSYMYLILLIPKMTTHALHVHDRHAPLVNYIPTVPF